MLVHGDFMQARPDRGIPNVITNGAEYAVNRSSRRREIAASSCWSVSSGHLDACCTCSSLIAFSPLCMAFLPCSTANAPFHPIVKPLVFDSVYNLEITGAAAQVSHHSFPYLLPGRRWIFFNQCPRLHYHPRRTKATLYSSFIDKRYLYRMHFTTLRHTFDSCDFPPVNHCRQNET